MTNAKKGWLLKKLALAIDVGIPMLVTCSQFPIWVDRSSEATVSGLFLLFALISCVPFIRRIKEFLKSPSAPIVWGLLFLFVFAMRAIIDEALIVTFFGTAANLLGALVHKLGCIIEKR